MDIKLTKNTSRVVKTHIAEYEGIDFEKVTDAQVAKLINQMVHRQGRECNLAEDFLE